MAHMRASSSRARGSFPGLRWVEEVQFKNTERDAAAQRHGGPGMEGLLVVGRDKLVPTGSQRRGTGYEGQREGKWAAHLLGAGLGLGGAPVLCGREKVSETFLKSSPVP